MRILVAFDKFKGSLTAARACRIATREIKRLHPDWTVESLPVTDGGDGFAALLTEAAGGTLNAAPVSGPLLERTNANVGLVTWSRLPAAARRLLAPRREPAADAAVALVELAEASGLALVPPEHRDCWRTTTYGTGQLIRAAAEWGARLIVLGVGGSATHDLGLGILNALGVGLRASDGSKIRPGSPNQWDRITRLDGDLFDAIPPIRIACDVENPLLGPAGAAAVFAPQKGLRPEDSDALEAATAAMADRLLQHFGGDISLLARPGAGAAGGTAFGLLATGRCERVSGIDLVAAWLDFEKRIGQADLVLTGEGRLDASSLSGKAPGTLARLALAAGKRVALFAGEVDPEFSCALGANQPACTSTAINPADLSLEAAIAATPKSLATAVAAWAERESG
ncbi:MAG: glycerate kinase [Puniceicoccaceae bacterium]|nr:MAG: glycerate kinase [Puniceicoccaceae bacterium]